MSERPAEYTAAPEASGVPFTPAPIRFRVWDGERMWTPGDETDHLTMHVDGTAAQYNGGALFIPLLSTGLHDADGREVFEGDILNVAILGQPCPGVVCRNELSQWVVRDRHVDTILIDALSPGRKGVGIKEAARVVGHVYEASGAIRAVVGNDAPAGRGPHVEEGGPLPPRPYFGASGARG